MRSKSVAARPGGEDKAVLRPGGQRVLQTAGPLALVTAGETRSAGAMKPGLY